MSWDDAAGGETIFPLRGKKCLSLITQKEGGGILPKEPVKRVWDKCKDKYVEETSCGP